MKKTLREYTRANKEAWNEVMPRHQAAARQELDRAFATPGHIIQTDENLLELFRKIKIEGKAVVHLCCNNGRELLSLKNMGAGRCLGIDISDEAVKEAVERASASNINCEYICSDVYDTDPALFDAFDIVHITAGCIGWLPDLDQFFDITAKLLRPNGIVLMNEIHPFSEMLPFDNSKTDNRLQLIEPYFEDGPIVETTSLDYVGNTEYESKPQYWFKHTLTDIFSACIKNGLRITHFSEHTNDISAGHSKQEQLNAGIPLSLLLTAEKTTL